MFEHFTAEARDVVVLAQDEARALKHNYIGTEHILLGLLREQEGLAGRVLESLDITVDCARAQVVRIVGSGEEITSGQIPFTPRAKKVLELSRREGLSLGHEYIASEHILLGLVRENDGVAARILLEFDADPDKIRNQVIRMLSPGPRTPAGAHGAPNLLRPPLGSQRAGAPWRPDRALRAVVREFARIGSLVLEEEFGLRVSRVRPGRYPQTIHQPTRAMRPRARPVHHPWSYPPHVHVMSHITQGLVWAEASVLWRPEGLELRVPLLMNEGAIAAFANDEVWTTSPLDALRREIWKGWLALASPTLVDDVNPDELRRVLDDAAARALNDGGTQPERVPDFLRRLRG